jgi:uncharacterized tellurite resistance protein B-like protein
MSASKDYRLGLLYLIHLLVSADGVIDDNEQVAIKKVMDKEGIPLSLFEEFQAAILNKKERDIYQAGIDYLNRCTDEEKLRAFVHLYQMSEVDGRVHIKEVRLLLYSIKMAGIEFNHVVDEAARQKSLSL